MCIYHEVKPVSKISSTLYDRRCNGESQAEVIITFRNDACKTSFRHPLFTVESALTYIPAISGHLSLGVLEELEQHGDIVYIEPNVKFKIDPDLNNPQ